MAESFKFRIMNPEIKKPETWPFLEFDVYIEDEATALVEKVSMFLDYDMVEITYFYEGTVRFSKGENKAVTVIKLSDDSIFKVAMSYNKFKKIMVEWLTYYNYLIDSGVYELAIDEEAKNPETPSE